MTTHAQFYGLLDYMSTSKYERNDLFTLWLEREQIETLPKFTYGRRINLPDKQDLRTAHARLVRLTISLIGNIISLSLAFRVCEELESADELDINVKEEINVFLFKAVKHVLHGLIYEQDDECFNTGTKPIGITKVSGLSIDDLLCCERRKCPILLQLFHGLNYNSGGFARVLKRQKILSPLVSFIEAEKDNLWEQLTKRMSPRYMENTCMDKRYSISNFEVEKKVTLPVLNGEQWRSFFLKQPIPKSSAAAARALGGTARSQTNTANSMSGNGPRVAQCHQQQQVTSNQLAGEATSARKPATANNTPSQSSGESDLSSDGKVETPLEHKRAAKRAATAIANNTPSQSLGESDLSSDGGVSSPLAKKSKKAAIPVDDDDDDEDDSNGKRFFTYPFDTYCNESTLSSTDCGIFAITSPIGLNDTTNNDHRRIFGGSVTIYEKDKDRLMYTHNTPINKRMFDDSLVLFAMNWFLELVGSYDIIVFSTLFSDDLRNKDPNYLQKYTHSVRKNVVRKHVNLFEKKLVLLPIHEEEHFSLIVLVNPGGLSPLALHFDPCGLHKTATYEAKVQQWLNIEYKRTNDVDDKFSSLELCSGKATRQKNGFDCGAFICLYAHRLIAMFSQLGQEQIEQVSICDVEKVLTIQDPEGNVLHFRRTMNTFLEKLMVLYEKKKGCARMDTDTSCLCIMSKIEAQVKRATSVLNDLHNRVLDEDARLLNEAIATLKETKEDIIRLKMVSSDFATKPNNKSLLDVHGEDSKDDTAMAISSSGSSDHSIDEVSRLQQFKEVLTSDEDTESDDDDDDDDDDDKEDDIDHSDEKANASKQIVLCRERWNQYNPSKPFAIQTNLLCWLCRTIEVMIDPNITHVSLADLPKVITKFISVLKPVVLAYNDLLSSARAKNASSLCNVVRDNEDTEIGEVIITLDAINNAAALSENNATLLKIQKAILLDKNEPRNEEDLQQKASSVTTATINTYIRLGHPTRNMLMHMLHILFVHFILDELNLTVASSHLSHDAIENLLSNTANLATKEPSQAVEYSPDLPINILLVQFIIPALNKSETLVEATAVLLGIFDCLAGPGVHKSPESSQTFENNVLPHFDKAHSKKISSGSCGNSPTNDYCGDLTNTIHNKRRRRMLMTYFLPLLKCSMEKILPRDIFKKHDGYMCFLFQLAPTQMYTLFTFVKPSFFYNKERNSPYDVKQKCPALCNELDKTSERKGKNWRRYLIIDADEQVESLEYLFRVAYVPQHGGDGNLENEK